MVHVRNHYHMCDKSAQVYYKGMKYSVKDPATKNLEVEARIGESNRVKIRIASQLFLREFKVKQRPPKNRQTRQGYSVQLVQDLLIKQLARESSVESI
jgi:hypothetical protein